MSGDNMNILSPYENNYINIIEEPLMHGESDAPITIKAVMLTTSDNPFDPFTEFDNWFRFDSSMNYNSCNYLARIAKTSDELSDLDDALAIEIAVDEIVQLNLNGKYKKVQKIITL